MYSVCFLPRLQTFVNQLSNNQFVLVCSFYSPSVCSHLSLYSNTREGNNRSSRIMKQWTLQNVTGDSKWYTMHLLRQDEPLFMTEIERWNYILSFFDDVVLYLRKKPHLAIINLLYLIKINIFRFWCLMFRV